MKKVHLFKLLLATLLTFTACGGDHVCVPEPDPEPCLKKTAYTMHHEETQNIDGTDLNDIVWASDNEYVATIKDNVITGQYVGKTTVRSAKNGLSFEVEVQPKYNTIEEPSLDWGASKADIKAKYGTPLVEQSDALLFLSTDTNALFLMYTFKDDKMTSCSVTCNTSLFDQLVEFLSERFVRIPDDKYEQDDRYFTAFIHCYGKIDKYHPQFDYAVGTMYNETTDGILVSYMKLNETKSRSGYGNELIKAFESLENALKSMEPIVQFK